MKRNLTKFFNLIKKDKQAKTLTIIGVLVLFIFTIGYSLSVFTGNTSSKLANIKVNDLSFNITTNSGTSDDRILHLQANKIESFSVVITNLNKISKKYELIYDVCSNSNCTSVLNSLPDGVKVEFMEENSDELNGLINNTGETKKINLLTTNNTNNDVYIRLNLNVGYEWNELELANQIKEYSKITDIIAYVDGVEVKDYPSTCSYVAKAKAYKNNQEITLNDLKVECDKTTKLWKTSYIGFADKIEINFKTAYILKDYILNLDKTDNGLEVDDTTDKNIRYVGASPKNYLKFNNETWRIIGVFNSITSIDEQGSETKESLVKIVRNESLGSYSWDTSESTINRGWGSNEWSQADLMTELNTDYINPNPTSSTTLWYNGENNTKTGLYDYSKNIKSGWIDKIAKVRWNLGGNNTSSISALNMYIDERRTDVDDSEYDVVTRASRWDGKVALIYASDYGYASTGTECRNSLYQCDNVDSKANNWLFASAYQWTLTHRFNSVYWSFLVSSEGKVSNSRPFNDSGVRPAVFLKSDVMITGGTGTESDPYIIE